MYGHQYSNHPEILIDSFKAINQLNNSHSEIHPWLMPLVRLYLRIFGIPDISFQLRASYFDKTISNLSDFKPKAILDAGSGIGFYSQLLHHHYPSGKIIGVDIDTHKLKFCKSLHIPNSLFKKANLTKFSSPRNSYDLIVNIDVLEHVQDYKAVLKNFYLLLKPGGRLYIHTPQTHQHRIFTGYFSKWVHVDHVREGFAPTSLVSDLKKIGFRNVKSWQGFRFFSKLAWEINQITLTRGLFLGGLIFPLTALLASLDQYSNKLSHDSGLTAYYLAQK